MAEVTSRLLKEYLRDALGGFLVGMCKTILAMASAEGIRGQREIADTFRNMVAITLPNAIADYWNKSYHSYYQKTDSYVTSRIDGFTGKHPLCILNIMFALSGKWLQRLFPYLDGLKLTWNTRPATLYQTVKAFLEDDVTRVSNPCGPCKDVAYSPTENPFSVGTTLLIGD